MIFINSVNKQVLTQIESRIKTLLITVYKISYIPL